MGEGLDTGMGRIAGAGPRMSARPSTVEVEGTGRATGPGAGTGAGTGAGGTRVQSWE